MANPNDNFRILRRLALLIGNDNYEQEQNKLNQSIKNATDLEQSLEKIKFKSTAHYDVAKHETMLENIITFTKTIRDGDLILFFFSGHSCQIDGTNYLINTGDDRISSGEDVAAFGTPLDRVIGRLRDTEASYMLVMILDCCRQYRIKNESKSAFQARRKGLSKMKASDKTLIQYACAANKTNPNNLYMECLLRNIVEENVNIVDIIQRITDEVTIESDERQRPFITHRLRANAEIFFNEILYSEIFIPRTAEWKSECCQRKKSPTKRTKDRTMRTRPANAMVSTEICESQTFAGGRNHDGGFGSIMNNLRSPQGLIVNSRQTISVADTLYHRIMKFKEGTNMSQRIAGKNISGYGQNMLCAPSNIVFHQQSDSYIICDYHNQRIVKRSTSDLDARFEKVLNNIASFAIAVDDEGLIYATDSDYHRVKRYELGDTRGTTVAGGHGPGNRLHQFNHPTYIFIGQDKCLYVSDSWNNRVMKWEKDAKLGEVVAGGNGKGKNLNQLDCPAGIAVDKYGTVYVADHWNHRIMRWRKGATEGDIIVGDQFVSGDTPCHLNGPHGLGFDEDGNLYVTDSENHRIQKYNIISKRE